MISFSHVSKTFITRTGTVDALRDVSLFVEKGDIFGVIGFSGAGKSTLIRMANLLSVQIVEQYLLMDRFLMN